MIDPTQTVFQCFGKFLKKSLMLEKFLQKSFGIKKFLKEILVSGLNPGEIFQER